MTRLEDPKVKDILLLLGVSGIVVASLFVPALPMAIKPIIDFQKQRERNQREKAWSRFNQSRLQQTLTRLYSQKVVEISEEKDQICLKLQKSVYLTPYPCDKQIEFLRQYYGLGKEVIYVVAQKVENADAYKRYFGL